MDIAYDRFIRLKPRLSTEKIMANNTARLDERLATLEADEQEILAAATQPVELTTEEEQWWPYLVEYFGNEDAIFSHVGLDRWVFDQALALVSDVFGERR